MTRRGLLFFGAGLALALALGWLAFPRLLYARAEQPLRFSHKTHVSDKTGFGCADCHPLGEDGRFAGIPRLDNCAGCHAEPQGDSAEEKRLVEELREAGPRDPLARLRAPARERPLPARGPRQARRARVRALPRRRTGRATRSRRRRRTASPDTAGSSRRMSECEGCHAEHQRERTACLACHK